MDKLVVEQKIESLRKCLLRVEERCPNSLEDLLSDVDAQDVLVLNLSRAVQLCVDISLHILSGREQPVPETMGQAFTELAAEGVISNDLSEKMRKAVGFRNIVIHSYQDINWAIVYAIAKEKSIDFKQFTKQVLSEIIPN